MQTDADRIAHLEQQVAALAEALDNIDLSDRKAVREAAGIVRWARDQAEQAKVRRADVSRNLIVVLFSVLATVAGGLILRSFK